MSVKIPQQKGSGQGPSMNVLRQNRFGVYAQCVLRSRRTGIQNFSLSFAYKDELIPHQVLGADV